MSDYGNYDDFSEYDLSGPNHIITVEDTTYLVQGKTDDLLTVFRSVDDLLECERDEIQKEVLENE